MWEIDATIGLGLYHHEILNFLLLWSIQLTFRSMFSYLIDYTESNKRLQYPMYPPNKQPIGVYLAD